MASQDEQVARAKWGAAKCAAWDRAMAAFWARARELAEADEGADPALRTRISRGALSEVRVDRDEKYS